MDYDYDYVPDSVIQILRQPLHLYGKVRRTGTRSVLGCIKDYNYPLSIVTQSITSFNHFLSHTCNIFFESTIFFLERKIDFTNSILIIVVPI
ncbi:hypothetical protein BpHYR1_033577 [Brachionus plicatilis]|uniref:Uncharacterized protein n=1 Tax=Brachionus plicatilis TaxID=10195 RepID=A0A3M7P5K7_BRAPC|nr:hypothetical protein BpHYR1_033577 [Brachionus plicatilis]